MFNKITNVSSEKQSGGITSGTRNNNQNVVINACIWKGRKEGFFSALVLAIVVEIIIRFIFQNMNNNNVFNVTSNDQQGGITAGIVNIFQKARIELSNENKQQIAEVLKNKSNAIHVSLQSDGGGELVQFAKDIKSFLMQQGYTNVIGVHTIMGFNPFKGVNIEKNQILNQ